jgi:hypothetical protein
LDLWQFHEINYDNDPDWLVERGALTQLPRHHRRVGSVFGRVSMHAAMQLARFQLCGLEGVEIVTTHCPDLLTYSST